MQSIRTTIRKISERLVFSNKVPADVKVQELQTIQELDAMLDSAVKAEAKGEMPEGFGDAVASVTKQLLGFVESNKTVGLMALGVAGALVQARICLEEFGEPGEPNSWETGPEASTEPTGAKTDVRVTPDDDDLGSLDPSKACDLSKEGGCEACQ